MELSRKNDTILVFPGHVEGDDWVQDEWRLSQQLTDDSIYQEFTTENAAYIRAYERVEVPTLPPTDTGSTYPSDTGAGTEAVTDTVTDTDATVVPQSNPSDESESSTESVGTTDTTADTNDNAQVEEVDSAPLPTEPAADVTSPTSLINQFFGFFTLSTDVLPFAQESLTTPLIQSEDTVTSATTNENVGESDVTVQEETASTEVPTPTLPIDESVVEEDMIEDTIPAEQSVTTDLESETLEEVVEEVGTTHSTGAPTELSLYPIEFGDFAIPALGSGQFITNVQLRMSFAAQALQNSDGTYPTLDIEYTLDGTVWTNAGSILIDGETSNAINGGNYLFALPVFKKSDELGALKVRVSYHGEADKLTHAFIDALWLQVDTETFDKALLMARLMPEFMTTLKLPVMSTLISDTLDFAQDENPRFVLRYESQRNIAIRFIRGLLGRNLASIEHVALIHEDAGPIPVNPQIDVTTDGLITVQLSDADLAEFRPGEYTLELVINEGGKLFTDTLNFQWGMLALNPDQAEYEVGATSTVAFAALSPGGNTLCDANLTLYIIDPTGFISREDAIPSGECNGNNVTTVPDYTAEVLAAVPGTYELYVEHTDASGVVLSHTNTTFIAKDTHAVDVHRSGPTRIYPLSPYTMEITLTAHESFTGTLTERVEQDFSIVETRGAVRASDLGQEIVWDVDMQRGDVQSFTYTFDAPDISPYLYTAGPATVRFNDAVALDVVTEGVAPGTTESATVDVVTGVTDGVQPINEQVATSTDTTAAQTTSEYTEHRSWQIASDATGSMIVFWTSGASIPSGWTCISCAATSTFYQRFPLGGSAYGTTGGTSTHTHAASGTVGVTTQITTIGGSGSAISDLSHAHTFTPTIGSTSTLPAYRQLRVIQNNSAGTPATIPAGAILIFDNTPPSGWAEYTAISGRYPRGENTVTSAGSNTHIHSVSGTTGAATGVNVPSNILALARGAAAGHTHTMTAATAALNYEPPYITVIFATSTVATATPLGAIAMWSDTPPAGWLNRSAKATDPFNNRFIKGASTYGTTGGSNTHTHDSVAATSSTPNANQGSPGGSEGASSAHTHMIEASNFTTATHTPPYVTVIFGKYYGFVPLYFQESYRWYANTNAITPTDPWPTGTQNIDERQPIDTDFVSVKYNDVIRLRLQLSVQNSTSTSESFKLQYGTTTSTCTAVPSWTDVGAAASSTAWVGYDNASVSDGATLSSTTLSGSDIFGSYEEFNPSVTMPNTVGIAQEGEWDYVLKQNGAEPATNYCFRAVKSDGSLLFEYTDYPMLITNDDPTVPSLSVPFDNEKVATTSPVFEFTATDPEGNDLSYEIQIDDTYDFSSTVVDKNTVDHGTQFENLNTPADKDPFTHGELIRFSHPTGLTNGTTYYWRVRAKDPNGSNQWGAWSTTYSMTVDTSVTVTTWHQTTEEQFDTGIYEGTEALATDLVQLASGSTTGTTTATQIDFMDGSIGNAWGALSWTDTETVGDIKYRLQYYDEATLGWAFIPESAFAGNSVGFDTSPVSLLSIDTDVYRLIRVVGVFTNSGGSPTLSDWTVSWGYRIPTPTNNMPFPNEKVGTTTPTFEFVTTDPQGDDLIYEIQWSTSYAFTSSTTRTSDVHAGFANIDNGGDTSPFNSGDTIRFTLQAADALTNNTTYWWRIRARDPAGSNEYSFYTDSQSLTVDTTVTVSTWFQTTAEQFDTDILSGTKSLAANTVTVATTSQNSLIAYAEGTVTTPRYRLWDGTSWSTESSALTVGAPILWTSLIASPIRSEYVLATLSTDYDVNVQVYSNGSWGNLQEVATNLSSNTMRGMDVAYEQLSGDALVVHCAGGADPSYSVWNGTSWTSGGTINITNGNACGWIKLISDPVSDEIIMIERDTGGALYEAWVWNGSSWGNGVTWGAMQNTETNHEGIAASYEESGNQAVVVVSNDTNANFSWRAWNGTSWTAAATQALGDDFESGTLVADDGSDNMALCYHDNDGDLGAVRWTGAAWTGQIELELGWTNATAQFSDRPIDCAFEVGGSRDGYIMVAYTDTTNLRYTYWNGTTWSAEATISTVQDGPRVQVRRTGNNLIQVMTHDNTNDRYDYSYWNGTSWSTLQTLETNAAVGASPYREAFMIAAENPASVGSLVGSPAIDFYAGSGPYWKELSWTDSEPSGSTVLYQVEYYDGDSWELVPDSLLPQNSVGTSTGPVSLSGILPVSTYRYLRPVANLTCSGGTCPTVSDWTITWSAGITVSGTAQQFDQSTNVTAGTVGIAINGVLQAGKTGTISGGVWSIANVNAAPGDIVTVFVSGANDTNEAVAVARYDGVGDMSGLRLYEQHVALGSNDATSTPFSNAQIGVYDFTQDEDLFFDVSGTDLSMCAETGCGNAELYILASTTYAPGGTALLAGIENNGTLSLGGNTLYVSRSWDNNATTSAGTSTVVFTATSTVESIDETGASSSAFYNLTFGTTTGSGTWSLVTPLDVNNDLTVTRGTLSRGTSPITIGGSLVNSANGVWTGVGTTTFDGTGTDTWTDSNVTLQNIGRLVVDGISKTLQLGSHVRAESVTIGLDDILDVTTGNYTMTVNRGWMNNNTFVARSGTVAFAGTTTNHTITVGGDAFYNLQFTGAGGSWSFSEADVSIGNTLTIATGTVTLPTGTTTVSGSFTNSGGTFLHNNGTVLMNAAGVKTVTLSGTPFTNAVYNLRFSGAGTWSFTESYATTSHDLTITQGTVTFPSANLSVGGSFTQSGGTFVHNSGTVKFTSAASETIDVGSSSFNSLSFTGAGSWSFLDASVTALGSVWVTGGTLALPSGTLTVGGSYGNWATVSHSSGTVLFNSTDTGETVYLGTSPLYNMTFSGANGGWTITNSATTTGNVTLTSASAFTLGSGSTLSVGGVFTNSVGGASTTWTGSTLSLEAGAYALNAKTNTGDVYDTLRVRANTAILMWNSSATNYDIHASGSLYSQDHAGVDGDLYIFGAYARTSGTEYWSYGYDFDGTSLGTSSRQVDVKFASGASAALVNSTLYLVGTSTATTTIRNQGSGTYTVRVEGGTTTASHYDFADLDSTGVTLTGATHVTSLSDGRFVPSVAAGTGLTVASTTIDANAALQIFRVEFSTTSPIGASNVTQNDGTPTSYWWFRESTGNIDGESFDTDTGDPGSIRWDDSSLTITVSGTVYLSDESTPLSGGTCGTGNPVRVVVEGGATYDGACDGSGNFSIPNVVIVGDPTLTVFLNGASGGERAVTITKTPTTDITNLDLIVNRVVVRHEDVAPMTIADMTAYDSSDDSDIPFSAGTGTPDSLTVASNTELHVHASSTFTPLGTVTLLSGGTGTAYDGTLHIDDNATFTGAGTTTYSIGGSFLQDVGGSFIPASSTVLMTATTTGKGINTASGETIDLHELQFVGVGGGWNMNGNVAVYADVNLGTGTLTGTGNITVEHGSFFGNGLLSLGGGTTTIQSSNTLGGTQNWTFGNLTLGTGVLAGTTTPASSGTTTILGTLTISTAHFLNAHGSGWDLRGTGTVFIESGTFLEGTSTVRYSGTSGASVLGTTYYNLNIDAFGGSPTYTGTGIGILVLNNLSVGGASTTTFTLDTSDPLLDVNGSVHITSNGSFIASNSGAATVGGNWDNDGVFTGSGGVVTFDSAGVTTIAAGTSWFSGVTINGTGDFTLTEHATATTAFTLTSANDFTVGSGNSLAIGGTFTNNLSGVDTNWAGATLYLYGGGNYTVNATSTGDAYSTLRIGANTQVRMWNSSASTTDAVTSGSLYSQDHAGTNGDLFIFGDYVKTTGTDHWSYATDFDGTALGSPRQAHVYLESGATVLYQGGGLSILGTSAGTTTVGNQGSGIYSFRIGGTASTSLSYYSIEDIDASGLTFSGAPSVSTLSYGNYTVGVASGTALTVGGTVIDQNPAKTFTNNNFSTTTGVSGTNVTATGTSVSSWRFTNHAGTIDGEAYDLDPDGDPGYIVWDDSAASISISGHVYSDEGTTASAVCDGSTQNVHLRVQGLTSYTTSCNGVGLYTISGVTYSPGDSLVVFIDGEAEKAATVSEDPVSNINNLDLYENRTIVRHEGTDPLSIVDMAVWDSSDDADIPFTALDGTPDTLTLPANRKLIVWTGKEFEPNGNVTVSGGGGGASYDGTVELYANALFDATGAESHTIGGSLISGAGASIDAETSTFTFTTSGASRTIDTNDAAFYNMVLNGSGSWVVGNTILTALNDFTITQGSVTLPTGTTTIGGSFLNTGGSFSQNGGHMYFTASGAESIRTNGSNFGTTTFNGAGSWTYLDTNATSTGDFTIMSGTLSAASGTLTIGGNFVNSDTFIHNNGTLRMTSSAASTSVTASSSDLGSLTIGGAGSFVLTDENVALMGTLQITQGTLTLASGTLSVGGSFLNIGGAFNHASGTVLFNSTDGGETINPGASEFHVVSIAAPNGGYTVSGSATSTSHFSITSANQFTQESGTTLSVGGVFTNLVGGASTTWTGSTLRLTGGVPYTINTKVAGDDTYHNIVITNNTDVRLWNSSGTTTILDTLSSLYSQDHAGINGELYIYGNYSRSTGADYWSYATDFDATTLTGGSERVVTVRIANGATTTFSGGTLEILGGASATTTITNQGSGTYAWNILGGTVNALNYAVRNVNADGLVLGGTTTVTSLANGDFELAVGGGALITIASTTLNYNASMVISGMRFATTSLITGTNVALVGTTPSAWTFTSHRGNFDGEYFDDDGIDDCGSLRWDDSACLLTQQSAYRWRHDDGGEGVPDSEWFDTNWSKRTRVTITNTDATEYSNAVVEVSVPYDADMQADFDDIRFTDGSGTTTLNYVRDTYTASTEATMWVKVPTLAAAGETDIYMYYGNGSAVNAGVGTTTFITYDDFEDNNITEYSGDTSLFQTDTTFAYQGTYGLEAANTNGRTTDGIYRTGVTVSQGETIRYMQYIDTSAGSGDETCTLFGVQSPGSNNNNYAVCLEQFGTDRISIVQDAYDNDTNATVLASTTVTYTTGWYEVEIDWGTDDSIAVSLLKDDVLIATTSTTDTSYTSGGIGFTFWFQNGGWDVYSSRPLLTTEPTTTLGYEQVRGGASWMAALNTKATGVDIGDIARARFLVENTGLSVSDAYQIEYAAKGASPSCESVSGAAYTPVPTQASCGSSPICMQSSTYVTNNEGTTDVLGGDGTFTPGEVIEDPSNTTGSLTIDSDRFTEVEYALTPTSNVTDASYCFRVTDNGTDIDSYTRVAEFQLRFAPNITSITFNNGLDIALNPGATTTIYATGTVTDLNGYTDIVAATTTMFRSGVTGTCTADNNNCYIAGASQCTFTNCSGSSCDIVCSADFYYHADPTDTGSIFDAQSWGALLTVRDQSDQVATQTAPYIDLLTLRAITVDNSINYGALEVNADTGSYNATTTIENIGNDALDISLEGTDLTDGGSSVIPVSEQHFATSSFTYSSCVFCTPLSTSTINYELDLSKPTSTTPSIIDQLFWGIAVPFGVAGTAHQGVNTFYAIGDGP